MRDKGKGGWKSTLWQIAALLALFFAIQAWRAAELPDGEPPPLAGRLIDGGHFDLASAGRPLLVHFWASWCPVCKLEEGGIDALARDHEVISVALQSGSPAGLRAYMARQGLDFPVIADPDGELARRWGIRGVPASLIIGADGRIAFRESGYTSSLGLRTRLWWAGRGLSPRRSPARHAAR